MPACRITAWRDPFSDPSDSGYQIVQSLYAIGSGGLMGLGLGKSRQKYLYLPEEHNDYIFAIVCEELGFVGAVLVVLLFALLIIRGYWIAMHARDRFGALITAGLTTLLALQVFFNIGVVTNFLPATGISLPFFSYGGTALMLQLFEMGIVLSVSRQNRNNLILTSGGQAMNVIFTCGGTGGHINPAIAVAKMLQARRPNSNILFIGAEDGMENKLVPREGFRLETVRISNFQRSLWPKGIWHNLKAAGAIIGALRQAGRLIDEFSPTLYWGRAAMPAFQLCMPERNATFLRQYMNPTLFRG